MKIRKKGFLFISLVILIFGIALNVQAYMYDFESGGMPPAFSGGSIDGTAGYATYGFGNYFLWSNGSTISLTLTGLASHDSIDIGFLLAIVDSWDGGYAWQGPTVGPDYFNVSVDGVEIFQEAFDNSDFADSYIYPPGGQLVSSTNLYKNGSYNDSAYNMGLDSRFANIAHTSSNLTISWWADGTGWQGINDPMDESFAIDNLEVVLHGTGNPVPEPATMLLLGSGILGLAGFRKKFKK